jgi:hypothetical protein
MGRLDDEKVHVSHGWMWRCFQCGAADGTFVVEEHAQAAAAKHEEECPNDGR